MMGDVVVGGVGQVLKLKVYKPALHTVVSIARCGHRTVRYISCSKLTLK